MAIDIFGVIVIAFIALAIFFIARTIHARREGFENPGDAYALVYISFVLGIMLSTIVFVLLKLLTEKRIIFDGLIPRRHS